MDGSRARDSPGRTWPSRSGPTHAETSDAAVGRIYQLFGEQTGADLVGDKTPGYIDHLPMLLRNNPHAKVIQMVRHPLDVVASLKRQPWGPDDALAGALHWRRSQERARDAGLAGETHLIVRLEDLIDDPERTARRMAEHLGVEFDDEMLDHSRHAERFIHENIHPGSHGGLRKALAATRDWSSELDASEAELLLGHRESSC